jgi:YD repeat-containing protein
MTGRCFETERLKVRRSLRALATFILALALAIAPASVAAQQGGTTRFVYDDNGRLRAVVSAKGEAAIYEYDAAGNFTAIRRLGTNELELLDFFPKQGVPGDLVTFIGVGFGAGVNSVSFNGAAAQVVETTNTTVTATVPLVATTGLVTINAQLGTVTTVVPFTIRGVRVDPSTARIFPNETVQFQAVVRAASPDQTVTWSVNEIEGGSATLGTITTNGFYTAPNQPAVVIVRATSNADSSLFGEAIVTVQDRALINTVVAPLVSVRRGVPPVIQASAGVSVQRGAPPEQITSANVSVQLGFPPGNINSAGVSVTNGPHISSISPATLARGATVSITINGTNLGATTSLSFFTVGGALDSSITVSGLNVNGDGNSLTATVTVSGGTALGRRFVVIFGSAGHSPIADIGTNAIEIVP